MSEKREKFLEDAPESPSREYGIYVSDIARGVTDEQLRDAFSSIGKVYDALIVKNKFTGETKGYGFVRFYNMDDVFSALDCKELPRFEDSVSHKLQTVRVTIADPKDTLYLGNIPRGWTEEDVMKVLFELGGDAPRKFRFAENSKNFGFVTYRDHESAVNALKLIQRPPPGSNTPFTAYLAPPKFSDPRTAPTMKVLFVRGIGQLTSNDLKELFGGASIVEKVVVPFDSVKKSPLGHAYVHFFSSKSASEVKEKYNGYEHEAGRCLSIEWSLPRTATKKPENNPPFPEFPHYAYPYPYPPPYPYMEGYPPYPPPYYGGGEFREVPHPHYPYPIPPPPPAGHSSRQSRASTSAPPPPYPHESYAYPPQPFYGPTSPGKAITHKANRYLPYQR